MVKNIDSQNKVQPIFQPAVEGKVKKEFENRPSPNDYSSNVIHLKMNSVANSKVEGKEKSVVRRGLNFGSILLAAIQKLCLFGEKKENSNRFFYADEQRKFQLKQQLEKQWSQELVQNFVGHRSDW